MKKTIYAILFIYLSACSGKPLIKTGLEGKLLPAFNILLMDSATNFNTNNIPYGKPIILLYFSPSCPYCRALTEEIVTDMPSFTNVRFYILTPYPLQQVRN